MRHHLKVNAEQETSRMSQHEKEKSADTPKKEYTTPLLVGYGNVFDLTKNDKNLGVSDNPTMKT